MSHLHDLYYVIRLSEQEPHDLYEYILLWWSENEVNDLHVYIIRSYYKHIFYMLLKGSKHELNGLNHML